MFATIFVAAYAYSVSAVVNMTVIVFRQNFDLEQFITGVT
jgi:hypothetical protein